MLLDTLRTAEKLGISPRSLEKWRLTGGGPPFLKLGRRVLYDPQDLEEWLEESRRFSTSDTGTSSS